MDKFVVGTRLYGFCNGYFGRDSYAEKLVIACGNWNGRLWCVVETANYGVTADKILLMADGFSLDDFKKWTQEMENL